MHVFSAHVNKFSSSLLLMCYSLRWFSVIRFAYIFIAQKNMQYISVTFQCLLVKTWMEGLEDFYIFGTG